MSSTTTVNATRAFIENAIAEHTVVVFAKSWCPHCKATKMLFDQARKEFAHDVRVRHDEIDIKIFYLDLMPNGGDIQATLYQMTRQRTVPSVFVAGRHLGGNSQSQRAYRTGLLHMLINESQKKMEEKKIRKEEEDLHQQKVQHTAASLTHQMLAKAGCC